MLKRAAKRTRASVPCATQASEVLLLLLLLLLIHAPVLLLLLLLATGGGGGGTFIGGAGGAVRCGAREKTSCWPCRWQPVTVVVIGKSSKSGVRSIGEV